jgi:hypothetical protein
MKIFIRQIKSDSEPVYVYIVWSKKQVLELVYKHHRLIEGPTITDHNHSLFCEPAFEKEYRELSLPMRYVKTLLQLAKAQADAEVVLNVIRLFVDPEKLDLHAEPTDEEIGIYFLGKVPSAISRKERAQLERIKKEVLKYIV